jgi:hypothetical protein
MRLRAWVAACACTGALLLGACGRLGYDLLDGDDGPESPVDGGGASGSAAPAGGSGGSGGSAPPGSMDASVDANTPPLDGSAVPDAAPDSATDATTPPDAGDAGPDADTDAGPDAGDAGPDAGDAGPDAGGCTPAAVTDYCAALPPLPAAPEIDGELDCGPPLRDLTPVAWTSTTNPLPAGVSARIAAAWRPDGIYFFVDVTDDTRLPPPTGTNVWCGDGIELYIDDNGTYGAAPMYDAPGTIQAIGTAPRDDTTAVTTGGERYRSPNGGLLVGPWTSPRYGAFPRPGGYTFEAFIMADDLDLASWALSGGASVGLNVSINVSMSADPPPPGEMPDGCPLRLGQYFLQVAGPPCSTMCEPFINASAFCNPVLQ